MLGRFAFRRPLDLVFERGECVLVPQTARYSGLHADVRLTVTARRPCGIEDAHLVWTAGARLLRRSRWDRAVVEGKFRYPPSPLGVSAGPKSVDLTLTFTDALIPHEGEAPLESLLSLELAVAGRRKPLGTALWRLSMSSWDIVAQVTWVGPKSG